MQGRRILVVDDDPDFGSSLRDILVSEGYEVAVADCAVSAKRELERFAPGVALIDLRLGADNGIEVLTALKAQRPDMLCVLMTAFASIETVIEALQRQAYDYLRKPFHPDDLFLTLGRCFDRLDLDRRSNEAHAALRESEERFSNLIEASSQGVLVHNAGRPLYVNPKLVEMFGYDSRDELLGLDSVAALFEPDDWLRIAARYEAAAQDTAKLPDGDLRGVCRDGGRIWLEHRCFTLPWEGVHSLCSLLFDVTERRRTEEQLRQSLRMEAIGNLTGGIAHDFNNLLTIVLGNAQLLQEWGLTQDGRAGPAVDAIIRASRRGSDLTERLLAFSRRQPLMPKSVNLNAMVRGMENILVRTLGEHIDVTTATAEGLWRCDVDPGQAENAIINMAVNARDAMPGGGKLIIETANVAVEDFAAAQGELAPGEYVVLSVTDSGTGMSEEIRQRIFEPFFTTKELGKGTGLGLSMVYGFAKQSGGHVTCTSQEGAGSTFRIYLPRSTAVAAAIRTAPGPGGGPVRGESVLVVEDDADVRMLAVSILTELGYQVMEAGSADAALAVVDSGVRLDLLCTDVILPAGQGGCTLADEIMALRPDAKVLYMSGYTDEALLQQGRFDEGTHLLRKPFSRTGLRDAVRAALDNGEEADS